ncbi:MAG: MFS transporter [Acidimicrobiia bacterium]|nr:MFS transporter [Acidimicrobiia bacterium]
MSVRSRLQLRLSGSERYRWIVLAVGLVGLFSVGFSITVLAVSVKSIAADLDASISLITWVVTGPILAYAVFGPSSGKLADILGARTVYLWSLVAVAVFAALSAVAATGGALVGFRVAGAAVGAAVGPASLAIINRLFPPVERAKALGFWAMVAAGGPVLGVVVGGPVVEAFSWRWIFVGQVPITVLALVLGWLILPHVPRQRGVRFDIAGSAVLAVGVSGLLLALNRGPEIGWEHPFVIGSAVVGVAMLVAFVLVERRVTQPLLPMRYMVNRNFAFPVANQFFLNFAYMGGFIITPLLLQDVLGYGEARTGLISIFRPIAFTIAGPVAGYLTVRVGERFNATLGGVFLFVSMLGLASVTTSSGDLLIIGALVASGLGMGTAAPAMASSVANAVSESDLGVATAFQQMCAHIGTVIGTQVLLTTQASLAPVVSDPPTPAQLSELTTSYRVAYLVGGLAAIAGIIAALFVRRTRRVDHTRAPGEALDEIEVLDGEVAPAGARP